MSLTKNRIMSNLLQKDVTNSKSKTLIKVIDDEVNEKVENEGSIDYNVISSSIPNPFIINEAPTILEMMILAQNEANSLKKEISISTTKIASNSSTGFKKGFFNARTKSDKTKELPNKPVTVSFDNIIEVKKNKESSNSSLVFDDVQKALEEDQHPMLKALKQKEWITPDLTSKVQSNSILSDGLKDPNCLAAISLMQTDPKKAMSKYQNDPKITRFLKEFGAIMANHFENLSETNSNPTTNINNSTTNTSSSSNNNKKEGLRIQEIPEVGPLHAKVLSRIDKKDVTVADAAIKKESTPHEDKLIKQILQDDELRTMLMDPILQQILIECGEPEKFRKHMQNPEVAKKILRLQHSGLVNTMK